MMSVDLGLPVAQTAPSGQFFAYMASAREVLAKGSSAVYYEKNPRCTTRVSLGLDASCQACNLCLQVRVLLIETNDASVSFFPLFFAGVIWYQTIGLECSKAVWSHEGEGQSICLFASVHSETRKPMN